jgi:hypothetical protein
MTVGKSTMGLEYSLLEVHKMLEKFLVETKVIIF